MKYLAVLITFIAALMGSTVHAKDIDMPSLMALFASSKNIRAEFVERKFVKVLDAPVESNGELVFQAPNRLEKRTILPRPETLVIEGGKIAIERGTFKRTMSLDDFADMASLVQSLTATFRGDQVSIEQFFNWKLTGPANKWHLVLSPKTSKLFITLKDIRLSGDNSYVYTVETTLTDGDRSLMTLDRPIAVPSK